MNLATIVIAKRIGESANLESSSNNSKVFFFHFCRLSKECNTAHGIYMFRPFVKTGVLIQRLGRNLGTNCGAGLAVIFHLSLISFRITLKTSNLDGFCYTNECAYFILVWYRFYHRLSGVVIWKLILVLFHMHLNIKNLVCDVEMMHCIAKPVSSQMKFNFHEKCKY